MILFLRWIYLKSHVVDIDEAVKSLLRAGISKELTEFLNHVHAFAIGLWRIMVLVMVGKFMVHAGR